MATRFRTYDQSLHLLERKNGLERPNAGNLSSNVKALRYWCNLYNRLKLDALCLDIEVTQFNGDVAIIGVYQPREGPIEYTAFVKGKNLSCEKLRPVFRDCKMLVTYNGVRFDVPRIKGEFPGIIPDEIPTLDLYLFARKLGLNTSLRVLESMFGIQRLHEHSSRPEIAIGLWKRYKRLGDPQILQELLDYNQQDTINLYPLAEKLVKRAQGAVV